HMIDHPGDAGAIVGIRVGEPARDPDRPRDRAPPAHRAALDARVHRHRARRGPEGLDGPVGVGAVVRPPGPPRGGPPDLDSRLAVEVADGLIQPAELTPAGTAQVVDPAAEGELLEAATLGERL